MSNLHIDYIIKKNMHKNVIYSKLGVRAIVMAVSICLFYFI